MTLQQEVTQWADSIFGRDLHQQMKHLWEEIEEAFAQSLAISHEMNVIGLSALQEELADAGLILYHAASTVGLDLPEPSDGLARAMRLKLDVCKPPGVGSASQRRRDSTR